jgi:hypothetical protein
VEDDCEMPHISLISVRIMRVYNNVKQQISEGKEKQGKNNEKNNQKYHKVEQVPFQVSRILLMASWA